MVSRKSSTARLPSTAERTMLREQAHRAGREMSARSVMFYTVVAERMGLGVSDLRAWDLLLKDGPITASRFAELTGLTPGAVTGLIDRLVKAGVVKRSHDSQDRRRVIISVTTELRQGGTSIYFDWFQNALAGLYKSYSDDELRFIESYHTTISGILKEAALKLGSKVKAKKPANSTSSKKPPASKKPRRKRAGA